MIKDKVRQAYLAHVLEKGNEPESIYAFCKKIKIKETDFYEEYTSFKHIESDIWKGFFLDTITEIQQQEVYESYSVREKTLSFYYTLIEVLKQHRSFILKSYEGFEKPIFIKRNTQLTDFKDAFKEYISDLMLEAQQTNEVLSRPIPQLSQHYPDLFWAKTLFILDFWVNETNKSFEKTDTIIEKSVNTAFDFLGHSPLDSLLDLGKFLFQNRK